MAGAPAAASGILKLLATWGGPALSAAFLAPMITGPMLDYKRQNREQALQEKALRNKGLADAMLLADDSKRRQYAMETAESDRLRQLALMQRALTTEDRNRGLDRLAGILGAGPMAGAAAASGPMVGPGGLNNADLMLLSQSGAAGNGLLSSFGYR